MKRTTCAVMVVGLVAIGIGCRPEPRSTTMHEPGVYRGAVDPLIAREAQPQQRQELVDRLNLVQRDR